MDAKIATCANSPSLNEASKIISQCTVKFYFAHSFRSLSITLNVLVIFRNPVEVTDDSGGKTERVVRQQQHLILRTQKKRAMGQMAAVYTFIFF